VLPDNDTTTWEDFTARQAARETGEASAPPKAAGRSSHRKRPKTAEAADSLAALLMQAIHVAGARRGRLSQAESVREQTLLEVLTASIRRAQ